MSLESDASLAGALNALIISDYWSCAATTLVLYDYIITLKHEVDLLWRKKWSIAAWIFVLNRYLLLAYAVSTVTPWGPQTCLNSGDSNFLWFLTGGDLLKVPLHVFTIARVFVLLQGPWKLAISLVLIVLCLFVFISDTYIIFGEVWAYVEDPILGPSCYQTGFTISETIVVRWPERTFIPGP